MLRAFIATARSVGILLGCFVVVFSTLDVLGLVPHSYEIPSVTARGARYIALLVFAAAFLFPYRRATTHARQLLAKAAVVFMVVWTLYISVRGLYGYAIGDRAWQVIPLSIVFCTIVAANIFAFVRLVPKPRNV